MIATHVPLYGESKLPFNGMSLISDSQHPGHETRPEKREWTSRKPARYRATEVSESETPICRRHMHAAAHVEPREIDPKACLTVVVQYSLKWLPLLVFGVNECRPCVANQTNMLTIKQKCAQSQSSSPYFLQSQRVVFRFACRITNNPNVRLLATYDQIFDGRKLPPMIAGTLVSVGPFCLYEHLTCTEREAVRNFRYMLSRTWLFLS
ncbi:hypothetical protein V1504DRAFT_67743 [Lipomyces starkeyi]